MILASDGVKGEQLRHDVTNRSLARQLQNNLQTNLLLFVHKLKQKCLFGCVMFPLYIAFKELSIIRTTLTFVFI